MTIREQIEAAEKQLNALKEQERKEKEEARKRAEADKEKELTAIKSAITAFNEKYNDTLCLGIKRNSEKELFNILFPWL